ncbi:MAG: hypothetical protein ABSB09_07265 [Acidimicrobiales bacterium]
MAFRQRRVAVGVLGAAVLLAGCGGAASSTGSSSGTASTAAPGSPAAVVLDAYQRTVADRTADVSLTETVTGGTTGTVTVNGSGQVDFTTGDAQFTLTVPPVGSITMRLLKPEVYLQLPAAADAGLPGGVSWVSLDLDTVTKSLTGQSLSQLSSSADVSTDGLSYLEGVSADGVTTVGPATIDGVSTTEYSATIDLAKVGDQRPPRVRAALQRLESSVGLSNVPIQVWIDAQGQVRQESFQETVTAGGASHSVSATIGYSDFGTPVSVVAPPANQVAPLSSLTGGSSDS